MMRRMAKLAQEPDFLAFEADIARDMYSALDKGYGKGVNEVKLVTHLVEACGNRTYRGCARIYAHKIHGPRSTVRFNYREKSVPKELGDMVVISVLSEGRTRILQRLSIVQNKKSTSGTWAIDPEQLFLLHHFPPFTGVKGLFRGQSDVTFANCSTSLGTYGFFDAPGDMAVLSAPLVHGSLGMRPTFSKDHPAFHAAYLARNQQPAWLYHHVPYNYPPGPWYLLNRAVPLSRDVLGNVVCCPDIYSFTQDWLQASIGEVSFFNGTTIDSALDDFGNRLVTLVGGGEFLDIPEGRREAEEPDRAELGILLAHLDIGHVEG